MPSNTYTPRALATLTTREIGTAIQKMITPNMGAKTLEARGGRHNGHTRTCHFTPTSAARPNDSCRTRVLA